MSRNDIPLPDDLATAHRLIREQAETLRQQQLLIERMQHQLERLLRQQYGRKSEKCDPGQLLLFCDEAVEATELPPEPEAPSCDARAKRAGGRQTLPANLPRQVIVHDLQPEQKTCPECGEERRKIGEETRERLEYVPASLRVELHVRPKYACKSCQGQVAIAARLPEPIEKGLPGVGLLSHVIVSKYADHLPLYRQERIFIRQGVTLSRSTLCDWMAACAGLLEPIWKAMHRRILLSRVIQTDDTPVPVQDHTTKGNRIGRLWVYLGDRDHPFVIYDYTPDRSRDGPERMLAGYKSAYLQSDAYSVYDRIHARGTIEVGCLAHARRKFHDAKTSDPELAHAALAWIGRLYEVESDIKDRVREAIERLGPEPCGNGAERAAEEKRLSEEIAFQTRQERSRPLWQSFSEWLKAVAAQVTPKSPMGEAIAYSRSNWDALMRYLEHGFLSIDNNASERAIRPIAVGRKNWLHIGSDRGGRTAAVLMSLVQSCRALQVEPFAYLRDVLNRVSTHPASRIAELLPDAWTPPSSS